MLTLARESRNLTQTDLAELMDVSQAEISKYETGMKVPTEDQVRRLATHLEYPAEFFYLNEAVRSFGSGCVYHRKRQSATETKLRHLLALINVRRIQVAQLLRAVNPCNTFTFEQLDLDEFGNNPRAVARALRAIWKLPPGPVQSVVRAIEDAGGIIIRADFGTDKIDALSQWLPGMPPVFLVNERIPTDRMRWTLTHEIGHIVMHRFPTEQMEQEADTFAGEFLLPEKEVTPMLNNLSLPKLAALKPYWRVSMNALLKQAGDLNAITPRYRSYLWMQMGKAGYRKHEPVTITPEEPSLLNELIQLHCKQLGYGPRELAKTMHTQVGEVLQQFLKEPVEGTRLKLVGN